MGLIHAIATCFDCGWNADSRNSMVLGAQHHRKTGHYVIVEQCFAKIYGSRESDTLDAGREERDATGS